MTTRVTRGVVRFALVTLTLAGCGRQVAPDPSIGLDLPAIGPDQTTPPTPPPHVVAAMDATGGVAAWMQARRLTFSGVVTAYQSDGSFYLTEHTFDICPWGNAIQVSAQEPQTRLTCRIMDGQYRLLSGDVKADVSPLGVRCRDYAEAEFEIATAPVRLLDDSVTLLRRPMPVMISGAWYYPIEATFETQKIASNGAGPEGVTTVEPYWTQGVYFQNQNGSRVDIIWLGNPVTQKFLMVRGYNHAPIAKDGVQVPTKVEIFQSDAEATQGQRLALIDLKR